MGVDFSRDPRRLISRWIGPGGCAECLLPASRRRFVGRSTRRGSDPLRLFQLAVRCRRYLHAHPNRRQDPARRCDLLLSGGRGLGADLTVQRRNPAVRGAAHPVDQTAPPRLRSTLARDPPGAAVGQHQRGRRLLAPALIAEDEPVLNRMRFRKGVPVTSDRHFARYLRSVSEFPRGAWSGQPFSLLKPLPFPLR
jgi:hypothetical protein